MNNAITSLMESNIDTSENWVFKNPVIPEKIIVYESDTLKYKLGNGISNYVDLDYGNDSNTIVIPAIAKANINKYQVVCFTDGGVNLNGNINNKSFPIGIALTNAEPNEAIDILKCGRVDDLIMTPMSTIYYKDTEVNLNTSEGTSVGFTDINGKVFILFNGENNNSVTVSGVTNVVGHLRLGDYIFSEACPGINFKESGTYINKEEYPEAFGLYGEKFMIPKDFAYANNFLNMTNNTTPVPQIASSDAAYTGTTSYTYHPYLVFNGTAVNDYDCWIAPAVATNHWVMLNTNGDKSYWPVRISMQARNFSVTYAPTKGWTLYGSPSVSGNADWSIIHIQAGSSWSQAGWVHFDIIPKISPSPMKRFKIEFNSMGSVLVAMAQIIFHTLKWEEWEAVFKLPTISNTLGDSMKTWICVRTQSSTQLVPQLISDTETPAYRKLNGKWVYNKLISLGNLPNTSTSSFLHDIIDYDELSIIIDESQSYFINENNVALSLFNKDGIVFYISSDSKSVECITTDDYSNYRGFICLQFTRASEIANNELGIDTANIATVVKGDKGDLGNITLACELITGQETPANYRIDGKMVYYYKFPPISMPNATSKIYSHKLTDIENIWIDNEKSYVIGGENVYSTSYSNTTAAANTANQWNTYVNKTNVCLTTGSDRSTMNAFIVVQFTKVTDVPVFDTEIIDYNDLSIYIKGDDIYQTWVNNQVDGADTSFDSFMDDLASHMLKLQ